MVRKPGFEPGSQRWQRRILTTILLSRWMGSRGFEPPTSGYPMPESWPYKTGALTRLSYDPLTFLL